MADRRSAGKSEARNHREDGGEGDCRDEAEEHRATDRVGQMDRSHVGAAVQILYLVIGAVRRNLEELGIVHQEDDRAEADDEGQDIEVTDEAGA